MKNILPNGSKTFSGLALAAVALLALVGVDLEQEHAQKLIEAVSALVGALGVTLGAYGRIDKEKRTEVALQKAKEIDVKELLDEAKVILDKIDK